MNLTDDEVRALAKVFEKVLNESKAKETEDSGRRRGESQFWDETRTDRWKDLTTAYAVVLLISISAALVFNTKVFEHTLPTRAFLVILWLLVSLIPICYWWVTSREFERWADRNPLGLAKDAMKFEENYFKVNQTHSLQYWAVITTLFGALFVLSR